MVFVILGALVNKGEDFGNARRRREGVWEHPILGMGRSKNNG